MGRGGQFLIGAYTVELSWPDMHSPTLLRVEAPSLAVIGRSAPRVVGYLDRSTRDNGLQNSRECEGQVLILIFTDSVFGSAFDLTLGSGSAFEMQTQVQIRVFLICSQIYEFSLVFRTM